MQLPSESGDLPEAKSWLKLAGPGAIMLATSLGSGEIYFWPNLSATFGAWVLLIAVLAIGMQYVINTEVSRYTITTGETIIRGFDRLWRPLPWIMLVCCILPWIWPGWSMGGATALTWIVGGNPAWYGAASLVLAGVLLSLGQTLYKPLEITQMFLIGATILIALVLFGYTQSHQSMHLVVTSFSPERLKDFAQTDVLILLSAFAFCGAGGTINLAQSHYVREKGFGMAARLPKLMNPLHGKRQEARTNGLLPDPGCKTNAKRWQDWWRQVQYEQFVNFFLVGCVGLTVLSLLAVKLVGDDAAHQKMALLSQEVAAVASMSEAMAKAFAALVVLVFFTSEVGVLDHVCRITADIACCKGLVRPNSRFLSEGAMYLYTVWTMVIGGCFIVLCLNIQEPPNLLVIAGVLSGIAMFIYSVALVILNLSAHATWKRTFAQEARGFSPFRLPVWRWIILVVACTIFGIFSVIAVKSTLWPAN